MDPDPNWKACHQHIYTVSDKFAGVNIYMVTQASHVKISMGWPPRSFVIFNWREIDNLIDFLQKNHNRSSRAPYHKRIQLWNDFRIKIICQSHHRHYHFNTTSDKIYMTNKTWLSNIPLIDSNTHEYAVVVLSPGVFCGHLENHTFAV
jgi:hypothetical protein